MKFSYSFKLITSISLLVAVCQFITGFMIIRQAEEALDRIHHRLGESMAWSIAHFSARALVSRDLAALYEHVRLAMEHKDVRHILITDPEGKVIMADDLDKVGSRYSAGGGENRYTHQETGGTSHFIKTGTGEVMADITVPISLGHTKLGSVILGFSHAGIHDEITLFNKGIMTTIFLGFVGAIVCTFFLAAMIARPVKTLQETTEQIASGNFKVETPVIESGDEFAFLHRTIIDMAKRLEGLVYKDPLTGTYNRQLLNVRLAEELARSRRHHWPLAMLIIDLDNFKKINDTFGHLVGDEILVGVAALFKEHIREEDCLARFGGEEFVILAPNMILENAFQMAERIRCAIAGKEFMAAGGKHAIMLTTSVGLAIYPHDASDEKGLISSADKALYLAKNSGRNRVCAYAAYPDCS